MGDNLDGDWGQIQEAVTSLGDQCYVMSKKQSVKIDFYFLTWQAKYSFVFLELTVF